MVIWHIQTYSAGLLKYSFILYHPLFVNWRVHGYPTYIQTYSRSYLFSDKSIINIYFLWCNHIILHIHIILCGYYFGSMYWVVCAYSNLTSIFFRSLLSDITFFWLCFCVCVIVYCALIVTFHSFYFLIQTVLVISHFNNFHSLVFQWYHFFLTLFLFMCYCI